MTLRLRWRRRSPSSNHPAGWGLRALGDGGPAHQGRGDMGVLGQRKVFTLEDTLVRSEPRVCVCAHMLVCV